MPESLEPSTPQPDIQQLSFTGGTLEVLRRAGHGWLVLRPACEALGLNFSGQRQRLERQVWAVVCIMHSTGIDGNPYDMFCLRSDCVAMWLATLDTARVQNMATRQRLEIWQCQAAAVLERWVLGHEMDASARDELRLLRLEIEALRQQLPSVRKRPAFPVVPPPPAEASIIVESLELACKTHGRPVAVAEILALLESEPARLEALTTAIRALTSQTKETSLVKRLGYALRSLRRQGRLADGKRLHTAERRTVSGHLWTVLLK